MVADFDSSPNLYSMLRDAIEMDLDANYVISVLENRNIMAHDFKARQVMDLAKKEGPYFRKVELAKELIRGEWSVVAEYEGADAIFQLVPIKEIFDIWYQIELIKERRRKEGKSIGETKVVE